MYSNTLQRTVLPVFLGLLLALVPLTAQAQEEPGAFYIGLQGGLNQTTLEGETVTSSSSQSNVHLGGFFAYNVNEVFSVQLGASYHERGADGVTAEGGPNVTDALDLNDATVDLEYVEIPVLFKLTAPIEVVNVRGFAGPGLNLMTSAEINGRDSLPLQSNADVDSRFHFYDAFGILGGEIGIPLPGPVDEFAIDGRYQFGLFDIDVNEDYDIKNQGFTGTASVRFAL
jgi:hypothetical protein